MAVCDAVEPVMARVAMVGVRSLNFAAESARPKWTAFLFSARVGELSSAVNSTPGDLVGHLRHFRRLRGVSRAVPEQVRTGFDWMTQGMTNEFCRAARLAYQQWQVNPIVGSGR